MKSPASLSLALLLGVISSDVAWSTPSARCFIFRNELASSSSLSFLGEFACKNGDSPFALDGAGPGTNRDLEAELFTGEENGLIGFGSTIGPE